MNQLKDPLPDRLRTRIVYKFSCASCNACYVGATSRHFSTRVHEHLSSDRSSHVYKHLQASESCRTSCNLDCFKILNHELIFSWLSWVAVLLVGACERRRRRQSRARWQPYSSKWVDRDMQTYKHKRTTTLKLTT